MKPEEKLTIHEIKNRNRKVFEMLFYEYYEQLVRFSEGILFDADLSKDVVQSFFTYLWEEAENIKINTSIKAYFFQSIRNRCFNRIKALQIQDKNSFLYIEGILNSEILDPVINHDQIEQIKNAMNLLPPKMLEIFKMKFIENSRHKEIAETLNISENTVKTQLSRAKSKLKEILFNSPI